MSTITSGKRSTTPKKQRSRSQSQQKSRNQEDVCVRISLPPLVEGPVYAILICHIPKLRWNAKYQLLCRYVNVKVSWWGEDDTSAIFKPQVSGVSSASNQTPSTTAKYYIRSELKQFARYLTDASELVLKIHDSESNRLVGTSKVQHLSTLSINNPIKGYQSIFNNKGDKLGELFVALRLILPGTHDSNENLATMSCTSDVSNPPSRRNSIGANDYNQSDQLENGSRTYKLDRAYHDDQSKPQHFDSTVPFTPYTQTQNDLPTGRVVEALIERANRLREDMIKSSLPKSITTTDNHRTLNMNNNNANLLSSKSLDILDDDIDPLMNTDNICDMLRLKSTDILNRSSDSILTDLDGLENEQSLLDDLLYGNQGSKENANSSINSSKRLSKKPHPRGKPPTGRSPSPSLARVGNVSARSRSARSRSLAQSSDSDTASRVSFDLPSSDLDDSGNESHDDNHLSKERIEILNHVRIARVRIEHLRLNNLNNDRESPSHSSFGRTNKSKRASTYFIEYQFPVIANSRDGQKNEATQAMKIASKRFESNNDIIFSHLSTYPCLFNENILKTWWRSLLIFKIYSRMSGNSAPEQIGFAVLPLRNILKSTNLHYEHNLHVIDRTQTKLTSKIPKKFCLGKLFIQLELDSDSNQFQFELDRLRLFEQTQQPKKKKTTTTSTTRKSSKRSSILKIFSPEENLTITTENLVVQIYLSIIQARNLPSNGNSVRNPYFVCRAFWNEQPIQSIVSWGCLTPKFNFEQKIPLILTKSILEKMHKNFLIIELWDKKISGPSDQLIGITKISLEQFYISFKDKQISQVLLRAQYPVISTDAWLSIIDPFTATNKSNGEIQVLLAMGTADQITAVQIAHTGSSTNHSNEEILTTKKPVERSSSSSSLIEHNFEIAIESIHGLRAFESMVWGESDCFIQYSFPVQNEQNQSSFQLRTVRTNATLCTSDPTFNDSNKFRYILSTNEPLHKYFYAACQGTSTIETNISFEVWTRFYYPNIRDQLLAKGKLQAAKLCGMTTMLNSERDNKSTQSFRIPLEIVRDDSKTQHISTPNYGGDLLISVVYKRNIFQKTDEQILTNRFLNSQSQVCLSVGIIRACGLKYAAQCQARHDNRLNYPSQVGLNTYAKLSISFLSEQESRTTRTVARSFVPEFNHSIDFPVSLISNQSISLAELLENGQLKIDIYHQMSSSNETNDKRSLDIYLCSANISLRELVSRHTGIKGWYSLTNTNRMNGAEIAEQCLGGLELFVRFGQQDDRRKVLDSAKKLGWNDDNYQDEENFLDNEKDLGCLMTVTIERIQFPIQLATRPGKDRLDEQTTVFVQYRLYDKMPILTQRKKPIIDRSNVQCDLKFHKEHLFLCSAPFLWYLREEKLEIQIWTSDNSTGEFSSTDKLLGSIYVDLNSLSNRKRKSHRLNAILPMFKHGCKDLGGAWTQVHVTIDKSKDFNELRNRNDDEIDFDHQLINNPQQQQQQPLTTNKNHFSVIIHIEQAAHLPTIYSKHENAHVVPNPYVTYSTADSEHLCRTHILTSTSKPIWNYQKSIRLSLEHLFNEKKNFLLKVWHKLNADIETRPESSGDKVLGFVSIDLSPLLSGLQQISGWYNIVDTIGNIQGQLKISIVPQEDLFQYKRMKYKINQTQPKIDSYRSTSSMSSNNSTVPTLLINDLSARSNTTDQTTVIDDENNNRKSFLMNNLHRQLGELDMITERLKARLHSGSEVSSSSTARCTSVPPFTNMNTHRQEIDSTRSTSTIQSDFLEHFPESLSGRPLMSNGLNVTDALSYHNDQVRLAQELMSKANHLLESSKDFFNKSTPALPPPVPSPPKTTTTVTVVERSLSPPPPPVLPNFNHTTEFQIRQPSPIQENQSPEQQQHASIIWSDDEDNDNNEQNQSFLPIGLPPTQHRLITQATESPSPPPLPSITIPYEEAPEIDVVHIRPLNNLSAFNFDCQQMNEERLNESFSPQVSVRRNIFSEQQQQQQQSPSSSSSSSTSDTSVIDSNWIDQQRPIVPERPPSRQPPSRSPHLAFLDRPLPNFFPTNREMEASIKQVSQALTKTNVSSRTTPNPPSPSNTVMKTIIERLRTKSSNDLLRTASPSDPALLQPNEASNVTRLEKIFKTKYTPSN